ncbi:hypothetical protein Lesp02_03350 [Lentzea sp. NBRC 105346]|uniref:hypothetical protein n=1 Tax=Lentzea sp. NBRC 105346 TaxID=3032205 RepID=UPI0024A53983|nr:hypothetical protein [Lentzea sp. NBRC 105346]GLZ28145.1 hypothetical protein Lesp02_03350 [Lentzea sp. NBRC 105346]
MTTPTSPSPISQPRDRRRLRLVLGAVAAVVLLIVGWIVWPGDDAGPERAQRKPEPAEVATVFLQRYATGDPSVCELATEELRTKLHRDGRCSGTATGSVPAVEILFATTCADKTGVDAKLGTPGKAGAPYAHLGLDRSADSWLVRSFLPIGDVKAISSYACASPQTKYGG